MNHPRLARDIMVTKLVTLRPDQHVLDGIAHLLRYDISGAPVVDEGRNYLGMFSEKCCMSVLTVTAEIVRRTDEFPPLPAVRAADFMETRLVTVSPDMDVFEAIGLLLRHRISGACVLDELRAFLGILSERYAMRALIDAAYDQLPTSKVSVFMNRDRGRIIAEDKDLLDIAQMFLTTHYRRLVVVREGNVVGQISRRDLLRAEHHLSQPVRQCEQKLLDNSRQFDRGDAHPDHLTSRLPSAAVSAFMDTRARTISEDTDLLNIAHIFLTTNYRRLPVLRDGQLIGQVSRRDLLQAFHELMAVGPRLEVNLLYLSSLVKREEAPFN